jgi:hypothetical protein
MTPRPPALETAAARGPPEVRAMPARRMGYLIPRRVQRGVVRVVIMLEVEDFRGVNWYVLGA